MTMSSPETHFLRFREHGDAAALAAVFDATGPELGRVASYLAGGNRDGAAELLQATWLSAIAGAGAWDAQRPLLPWLLGVLANHARSQHRRRRREVDGAAMLGTLLASDDPVRASEDREFERAMAAALEQLPAPFREAVSLHVLHGLTAKEIGASLGRPAGTVRTQIVRGLERLRQLLPAGLATAGLGAVALTAVELARVRAVVLAKVPVASASFGLGWRWVLAAGVVLAGVAAPFLWASEPAAPSASASMATPQAADIASAEAQQHVREPAQLAPQDPAPAPGKRPRRRLTVHVRHDTEPRIVAGELVAVQEVEAAFARTNAAGDAVFEDLPPLLMYNAFVCGMSTTAHVAARRLPPPDEFDLETTLELKGGSAVVVQVVGIDGKAVAGAEVGSNGSAAHPRGWLPCGVTDARGELRLRHQTDRTQFRARAAGHGVSPFGEAANASGESHCRLVLGAATTPLRGRVVDVDGKPVAAELGTVAFGVGLAQPWYDRTNTAGEFVFDWLPAGHVAIVARCVDGGGVRHGWLRTDTPNATAVEIRLQRGAELTVQTTDADGKVVAQVQVNARYLADGVHELPFLAPIRRTDAAGRLQHDGLLPGRWEVRADFGNSERRTVVDLRGGASLHWDAQAIGLRELRARLLDEHHDPLANWFVQPLAADGTQRGSLAWTDEQGRLRAGVYRFPVDEPITVAVFDPEAGVHRDFPVWKQPGVLATGDEVEIVVPDRCRTTHRVRGRIVGDDGEARSGMVRVPAPAAAWTGPSMTTGDDGRFELGPFPPGRLTLSVTAKGLPSLARTIDVPTSGDLDVGDVVMTRGARVLAVPEANDALPDDLVLELVAEAGGDTFRLQRGDPGTWRHDALPRTRYVLRGCGRSHHVPPVPVVLDADAVTVRFRCVPAPTCEVEIELADGERQQEGWSGTVALTQAGRVVVRRSASLLFRGSVPTPLVLRYAVPPGAYDVEVETWDHRTLRGSVVVGESGGVAKVR